MPERLLVPYPVYFTHILPHRHDCVEAIAHAVNPDKQFHLAVNNATDYWHAIAGLRRKAETSSVDRPLPIPVVINYTPGRPFALRSKLFLKSSDGYFINIHEPGSGARKPDLVVLPSYMTDTDAAKGITAGHDTLRVDALPTMVSEKTLGDAYHLASIQPQGSSSKLVSVLIGGERKEGFSFEYTVPWARQLIFDLTLLKKSMPDADFVLATSATTMPEVVQYLKEEQQNVGYQLYEVRPFRDKPRQKIASDLRLQLLASADVVIAPPDPWILSQAIETNRPVLVAKPDAGPNLAVQDDYFRPLARRNVQDNYYHLIARQYIQDIHALPVAPPGPVRAAEQVAAAALSGIAKKWPERRIAL